MKTLRRSHSATKWAGLLVLGLIVSSLWAIQSAQAGIRIFGRVDTPQVSVRVGTSLPPSGRVIVRAPRPQIVHRPVVVERCGPVLSPRDHEIAWRLSYLSGIAEHRLLHLRRNGYDWRGIGHVYDLPLSMMHASFSDRAFDRYLRHHGRRGGVDSCRR